MPVQARVPRLQAVTELHGLRSAGMANPHAVVVPRIEAGSRLGHAGERGRTPASRQGVTRAWTAVGLRSCPADALGDLLTESRFAVLPAAEADGRSVRRTADGRIRNGRRAAGDY